MSQAGSARATTQGEQLAYVVVDFAGGHVHAAANFASVAGFSMSADDAVVDIATGARILLEHVAAYDRTRVRGAVHEMSGGKPVGNIAFTVHGDDGINRSIECVWSAEYDPAGVPRRVVITGIDSSARSQTQHTLRESEARYRLALTAGRMGSWETDLVAGTRTWSEEGMALFGIRLPNGRGQVGGDSDEYLAALHPDDRHLMQQYHLLAEKQDSFPAEYRIERPDGTTLRLAGRGLVVSRTPGGHPHRLVSIMADVTERRQAEEELRVERERLTQALSVGQMGVYDFNLKNDVLWWSPQTYVVFGVSPETFKPTRASVSALLHPDDLPNFVRLRDEGISRRKPFSLEFRIIRPDGRMAWISHVGQAEYDVDGKASRSFGISVDITDRKRAEEALRDADRKKDHFIATLAHELRNPLAPIRNAVSLLRKSGNADPQVVWTRDVIDRQVGQMAHLLEDLLDVSRLTRGQIHLRREPLELVGVIEQAIEIAKPFIDAASHELLLSMPTRPLSVDGDLTRLAQVFSNLLINAAKYTPPNGRIVLTVHERDDEVDVKIADNGIGIAPRQLPHIFEMFGQVKIAANHLQEGLGIGLSLARGLVEMHRGRITARSEGLGKGSEFIVHLPLSDQAAGASAQTQGDGQPEPAGAMNTDSLRILVADDLHDSADSLAELLKTMGHTVSVAYDGEQALALAETFRPEVALLDLGMPKLNGYETCRRIRAQPWGKGVTLVAQTGWGQDKDRQQTLDAGFDHHIVKPIDAGALATLLHAARPQADQR